MISTIPLYILDDVSVDDQFAEAKKEWRKTKNRGADAGCWTDGMYMNLIRAKMIRLKRLKMNKNGGEEIPGWDIPAKVSFEFNHRKTWR